MFAKIQLNTKFLATLTLSILAVLISSFYLVGISMATPGSGVTGEELSRGDLPLSVKAQFKENFNLKTAVDEIVVYKFTVIPGGVFGWHQHGGPVWVVVESGTLTFYEGDDPGCTAINYAAGSAFMDPGSHTHNARNEGSEDLVIYATFMLPEGAAIRIDEPDPGFCGF